MDRFAEIAWKKAVDSALKDLFTSSVIEEFVHILANLIHSSPSFAAIAVKRLISQALDGSGARIELANKTLVALVGPVTAVTTDEMSDGFALVMSSAEDLEVLFLTSD